MTEIVAQLTKGWTERVEHQETVRVVRFGGLLPQLESMAREQCSISSGGGSNPNKSVSRPPLNMAPLNLIDDIKSECALTRIALWSRTTGPDLSTNVTLTRQLHDVAWLCMQLEDRWPDFTSAAVNTGQAWVKRARIMLGYETREIAIAGTVCHVCNGVLVVAADASSDVRCLDCGHVYPRWSWLSMLSD